MKIVIATPSKYLVSTRYVLSVVNMVKGLNDIEFVIQQGLDVVNNRILLVKKAIELEATHIFFIDDDMTFSSKENPLKKLLSHDKDIVGADYNFRQFPVKGMVTPLTKKSDGLYKCKSLPTGFMLIKMSVFDKLPIPWFQSERSKTGEIVSSEDTYFCKKAIENGFDVWCDPTIRVGHCGEFIY